MEWIMTWTGIARQEHSRKGLRYSSDMTDREWLLTAPFIPLAKSGRRKRTSDMREVVNAVLYVASSGCAWRMQPKFSPPISTVRCYFSVWRNTGLFESMNSLLVMILRVIEGRDGAADVLKAVRFRFPWLRHVSADDRYAGDKLRQAIEDHGIGPSRSSSDPTCQGLRSAAAPVSGRTHLCVARAVQATG
jgi:transposase